MLVILSDVPGVLTGDPRKRSDARLIPLIADAEADMQGLVADSRRSARHGRDGDQADGGAAGGARRRSR